MQRNNVLKSGLAILFAYPLMITSASAGGYVTGHQAYSVELNKTEILRLPAAASAVVVGNPSIADVSVHASDTLFVIGRGYGETNLIVLDSKGQTMMNADIQVLNKPSKNNVRIYNGNSRQSYNCMPNCQPSPILGDDPEFVGNYTSQTEQINSNEALSAQQDSVAPNSSSFSPFDQDENF